MGCQRLLFCGWKSEALSMRRQTDTQEYNVLAHWNVPQFILMNLHKTFIRFMARRYVGMRPNVVANKINTHSTHLLRWWYTVDNCFIHLLAVHKLSGFIVFRSSLIRNSTQWASLTTWVDAIHVCRLSVHTAIVLAVGLACKRKENCDRLCIQISLNDRRLRATDSESKKSM